MSYDDDDGRQVRRLGKLVGVDTNEGGMEEGEGRKLISVDTDERRRWRR